MTRGVTAWVHRRLQGPDGYQMGRGRPGVVARFLGRIHELLYLIGLAIAGLFNTLVSPFRRLADRLIFGPLNRWQLAAEERRNRTARLGRLRKAVHAFHYKVWRLTEWLNEHSAFFRWVAWPFVYLARIPGRIARGLGHGYEHLEERLAESRWLYWLYFLLAGVRQLASSTYEFSRSWFFTRNYHQLLGGIPAIMLFLPLAFCLIRIPFHSATAKARHYRLAAQDAWEAGDFDAARLYYRKIQQIGVSVEAALFQTAIAADEEGDVEAAYQQMKDVVDQYDFAPAKLWIVQTLLNDRLKNPPENAAEICDEYLSGILLLDPKNASARMLLASRYRQQGKITEALAELNAISREYPPAHLTISQIQQQQQNYAQAHHSLTNVLGYYQDRYEGGTSLDVSEFQAWIRALSMAGEYTRMDEVAADALLVHSDSRGLKRFIVDFYGWVTDRLIGDEDQVELRARLLERALDIDPKDDATMERMALLVNDERVGVRAKDFLSRGGDQLPANVHGALAVAACVRGDLDEARIHFGAVVAAHPESAEAANNLAWILINTEPTDLETALVLSTRAVELDPSSPAFRETRGQVLTKLGRWIEAVEELERALNGMPDELGIHQSLATAYEQLGQVALAEAHRNLSLPSEYRPEANLLGPN